MKNGIELSREFEAQAREFADLVSGLNDEQWQAICAAENWSVGTTAHHVAQSIGAVWGIAEAIVAGNVPPISREAIDESNARHAAEFPNPDRAETVALIEDSAATVAGKLVEIDEDALDRSAVVPAFGPEPLAVRTWIEMVVIGHFGLHQPSIEAAIGK